MKLLTRENIPCWYELSWQETEPAIILKVHKDFISDSGPVKEDALIVKTLTDNFKFSSFIGSFNQNFGFDNSFIRKGEKERFVEFEITIPQVKIWLDEPCRECGGSGRDEQLQEDCFFCNGKGKEYHFDWDKMYAISASFNIFSRLARIPWKETSSKLPQLMTIYTVTQKEAHGGSIGGEFSVPLCCWMESLRIKGQEVLNEMVEAMKICYKKMYVKLNALEKFSFRAYIHHVGGGINVDIPGDACGLNPCHNSPKEGEGHEFSCHNVDNPMQQLTLIAGLAALHDKARKEI